MTTPSDVITYLAGIKDSKITRMLPCYVTIGRQTYPAARYWETLMTPTGTPAYARGERDYTRETIYCVGFLPSAKLRGNVAFVIDGEPAEWYVAAYYGNVTGRKQSAAAPSEFHPFGNCFMMSPWSVPDGSKIDYHARVPYRRVAAHVAR